MTHNTLHLSVINDGNSYELRKSIARAAIAGECDHYSNLRDKVIKAAAQNERVQFGTKYSAAAIKEVTLEVMAHDQEECLQRIRDAYIDNPVIHVSAREWFDSVNGNSYHSVRMYVAGLKVYIPMMYGYGEMWKQTTNQWLENNGVFKRGADGKYPQINWGKIVEGKKSEL